MLICEEPLNRQCEENFCQPERQFLKSYLIAGLTLERHGQFAGYRLHGKQVDLTQGAGDYIKSMEGL